MRTKIKIASQVSLEILITDFAEIHTAVPWGQKDIILHNECSSSTLCTEHILHFLKYPHIQEKTNNATFWLKTTVTEMTLEIIPRSWKKFHGWLGR
jgi:hypothetical protein